MSHPLLKTLYFILSGRSFAKFPRGAVVFIALYAASFIWPLSIAPLSYAEEVRLEDTFLGPELARTYLRVERYEKSLYGQVYQQQSLEERATRIEKTLFGKKQPGTMEARLAEIEEKITDSRFAGVSDGDQGLEDERMIAYLEQKLFQQTYAPASLSERLTRLERHVFGKPFEKYPQDVRLKKLSYQIPLLVREVHLTQTGVAVATTARKPNTAPPTPAPKKEKEEEELSALSDLPEQRLSAETIFPETLFKEEAPRKIDPQTNAKTPEIPEAKETFKTAARPLPLPQSMMSATLSPPADPTTMTTSMTTSTKLKQASAASPIPSPDPSYGDYSGNIFRLRDGRLIRWTKLPVRFYIDDANPAEAALSEAAFQEWQRVFPLEKSLSKQQANILVSWDKAVVVNGPMTRPVIHLDDNRKIVTFIRIDMRPYFEGNRDISRERLLRGLQHQLGHALGLWGHSYDQGDIMTPSQKLEWTDIPQRWAERSARFSDSFQTVGIGKTPQPSQRDINTLTRIYQMPAQETSFYSPY